MIDLLNTLLGPQIDYQTVFSLVAIYIIALWLMLCLWVFMDANKRYEKFTTALLISVAVFVFNFPALIFYLIVRPEEDLLHELLHEEAYGGVNVPLVNFTGGNGDVKMTLALHIANQPVDSTDMRISVGWDSSKQDYKLLNKGSNHLQEEKKSDMPTQQNKLVSDVSSGISNYVGKFQKAAKKSLEKTHIESDKKEEQADKKEEAEKEASE